eukprot:3182079-Rhodomonas_salina.1
MRDVTVPVAGGRGGGAGRRRQPRGRARPSVTTPHVTHRLRSRHASFTVTSRTAFFVGNGLFPERTC